MKHHENDLKIQTISDLPLSKETWSCAYPKRHLRGHTLRKTRRLRLSSLPKSVMRKATHISCSLHKPSLLDSHLQPTHRPTRRTRHILCRANRLGYCPVIRVIVTTAPTRVFPVHHQCDLCDLEPTADISYIIVWRYRYVRTYVAPKNDAHNRYLRASSGSSRN